MIYHKTYQTNKKGKHVLFFGQIHGTEPCGRFAILKLMDELAKGTIVLKNGTVTCVPVCNESATTMNVRFIQEDLNRVFERKVDYQTYEQDIANELCDFVDDCDVLLDLHSMVAKSIPTVFLDYPTTANRELASALGVKYALLGYNELYAKSPIVSNDTMKYASKMGKIAVTLECGQNNTPEAVEVAFNATLGTLAHYGMIDGGQHYTPEEIHMTKLYIRKDKIDSFYKHWNHLDFIKKGEPIAIIAGKRIEAQEDCYILLPKHNWGVGKEMFYLGNRR